MLSRFAGRLRPKQFRRFKSQSDFAWRRKKEEKEMASFLRSARVVALLAIAAGIAVAASTVSGPVVSCSQYNQQTARLRQESQTELLPALTFSCTVYNQLANSSSPIQAGTLDRKSVV